jgi:DNA-binding NarL/FixJ family response regulator
MFKAIIIEDDELFSGGIKNTIQLRHPDIRLLGSVETGAELFALLARETPDILLLDIMLPDMSGIDIARRVKSEYPEIKILAFSFENGEDVVKQMLETGIEGFVSKQQGGGKAISKAIHRVLDGEKYYGMDISEIMCRVFVTKTKSTEIPSEFTEQERRILELSRDGLQSKEIAEKLCISPRTVDNHKNNMYRKLGFSSMIEVLHYAAKKGIIKMG